MHVNEDVTNVVNYVSGNIITIIRFQSPHENLTVLPKFETDIQTVFSLLGNYLLFCKCRIG